MNYKEPRRLLLHSSIHKNSFILQTAGAMVFDVEYAHWLKEHNKHINELRTAVNAHASDADLRVIVDNVTSHYNDIFRVKGTAAKADVFHILSGMWKTPAERCFMWIGGFRPSELLKVCILDFVFCPVLLALFESYRM